MFTAEGEFLEVPELDMDRVRKAWRAAVFPLYMDEEKTLRYFRLLIPSTPRLKYGCSAYNQGPDEAVEMDGASLLSLHAKEAACLIHPNHRE